jgi:hypothetical protein
MRGEFTGVWSETWREIWLPLIDHDGVPEDIFCELYRVLAPALQDPVEDDGSALLIDDAVLLREAFDAAVLRAGVEMTLGAVDDAFNASGATDLNDTGHRRAAAQAALSDLLGKPAHQLSDEALSELARDPRKRAEAKERGVDRTINDRTKSREAFEHVAPGSIAGERALVAFFEGAHDALGELGGDELTNRYFMLLDAFISKFSLRYDLRRPCILCPTLPGLFASLIREVTSLGAADANVAKRLRDFREAVQDLRMGQTEGRITNCVAKQIMLLEAIAATTGAAGTDLAALCRAIPDWPHPAVKASLLNLYGFASDFPGLRHGTPSTGLIRDIRMRDMIAVLVLLAGFTPYLSSGLNPDVVYRGA